MNKSKGVNKENNFHLSQMSCVLLQHHSRVLLHVISNTCDCVPAVRKTSAGALPKFKLIWSTFFLDESSFWLISVCEYFTACFSDGIKWKARQLLCFITWRLFLSLRNWDAGRASPECLQTQKLWYSTCLTVPEIYLVKCNMDVLDYADESNIIVEDKNTFPLQCADFAISVFVNTSCHWDHIGIPRTWLSRI